MREARTLGSWVIALFLVVMLFWMAAELLAPQPPARNHLFEVLVFLFFLEEQHWSHPA